LLHGLLYRATTLFFLTMDRRGAATVPVYSHLSFLKSLVDMVGGFSRST
jgi:hypothetical protein